MPLFSGRPSVGFPTALCALLLLTGGCAPTPHQAVHASEAEGEEPEPVAVTVFTDEVELFMEFPRLVPGLEARFLAHVTVLSTGAPVRSGQLRLELTRTGSAPVILEASRPARDGLFIPIGTFDTPGQYEAQIVVTSDQIQQTIPLQPIVVHPNLASAFAAADADAVEDPRDAVPFLLEQQWKIGLLMEQVTRQSLSQRLQVPGEIEVPNYARAIASAPLGGRLLPWQSDRLPQLGDFVEKGQVLALVEPPISLSDKAQLLANKLSHETVEMELLVQEYELEVKILEVEQVLQQSKARLNFAQKALARIEGLRASDLGTVAELEEAHRDVELAKQESEGSQAQKSSLVQSRALLDDLLQRAANTAIRTAQTNAESFPILAPIAGEIVKAEHVEGEHVGPQDAVFQILDLTKVWVAAHVSEFDLATLPETPGALMQLAAYPNRTFDLLEDMDGHIVHVARVVEPQTRTLAIRFEVSNPGELLHAGMFADVFLETQRAVDALAIPQDAIVIDNGRPVVFVLVHGELFQKRTLELGIRDGQLVEVLSGLEEGDRIVTDGAYLVKLASASPAAFGEGHAH